MNDVAQYMQSTGVLSKDLDEMDGYELYLHHEKISSYRPVLTRDEWEAKAAEYKLVVDERQTLGRLKNRFISASLWERCNFLINRADELERQLGW